MESARADELPGARDIAIRLEGPPECSDAAQVVRSGAEHGRAFVIRPPKAGEKFASFRIEPRDGSLWGEVALSDGANPAALRTVTGSSCDDVVDALALIVAVATEAESPPADIPPARPISEPTISKIPESTNPKPSAPPQRDEVFRVGALGIAHGSGVALNWPGLAFFSEGFPSVLGQRRAVRANVLVYGGAKNIEAATLNLTWLTGRLDGCPWLFHAGPYVHLAPCLGLEAGVLSTSTVNALEGLKTTRLWVTPHVLATGGISLGGGFSLEMVAGIGTPLVRDRYAFVPPGLLAYRAAVVVGTAQLGVGWTFF
jgi:hypothetical protein